MVSRTILWAVALASVTGCNTQSELKKMRLGQLERFEAHANVVQQAARDGAYDPARYDLYLKLDKALIDAVLQPANGLQTTVTASGRDILITLQSVQTRFMPGTPEVAITAVARDQASGLEANVQMDANLVIAPDPANPEALLGRITATRIVPQISWGPFEFTRRRFARDLLSLEAIRYTETLPTFTLPTTGKFSAGAPAGVIDTGRISTGNGSWIRGEVSYPGTQLSGQVAVKQVVVLANGIHVFADVEGLQ